MVALFRFNVFNIFICLTKVFVFLKRQADKLQTF